MRAVTLGDKIEYVPGIGPAPVTAIVTRVITGKVADLTYFPPGGPPRYTIGGFVGHDPTGTVPGTWRFPDEG